MSEITGMYRGKRIDELTREELMFAVINLGSLYNELLGRHIEYYELRK